MADQAQKDRFVAALTALGGSAGNGKLRDALGWDEATYDTVKQALIDDRAIVPGRGRGGSISIADAEAAAPAAALAATVDQQVRAAKPSTTAANVGYEAQLWQMADALRGSMDAAEYKHVVLGLIFLKYISDAFEEQHAKLVAEKAQGADPEDPDEYRAQSIFWVPPEARWAHLKAQARQSTIGQLVDDAMAGIERDNPALKGVLPKDYARPALDKTRLGQLIDLISNIKVGDAEAAPRTCSAASTNTSSRSSPAPRARRAASSTRRAAWSSCWSRCSSPTGAASTTPAAAPRACSCSRWSSSARTPTGTATAARPRRDISIYGQESNYTTWRLAKMNLAIRGIDGQIAHGDTFHNDRHPDLKADFILANPPFNICDWGGERLRDDKRWQYGVPPAGNANFAWVQHIIHHLAPAGVAGFVLANGSMSSNQSGEGEIRKNLIEADLVDCMVALPGQLFYSTQIPACLWFLARDRKNGKFRDRRGQVLFIDARKLGRMVDRTHRELTDEDIARIAGTYHAWRGEKDVPPEAVDGRPPMRTSPASARARSLEEVRKHGHVLTPGRYVGAEAQEDDGEPFEEKMKRLTATLREQQAEAAKLDAAIAANLRELGYGG